VRLSAWLNVRPEEVRPVTLSFWGAFLVISFLVLARSLREALYLTTFPVESLPYVTIAVAVLSIPTVGLFVRQLSHHEPRRVLRAVVVGLGVGLAALWPVAARLEAAVVAFYLWTALGTLLLTSGFWVVTADYFPVRGAKRVFGLIATGGTAGAMVMGNSISWLTSRFEMTLLIPGLIILLVLFLLPLSILPKLERAGPDSGAGEQSGSAIREGLSLVRRTPHLRTITLIVLCATMASVLIDYQFKELARATLTTKEELASFFGAFYGWTGAIALMIQLLIAGSVLTRAGIAATMAVLPMVLLFGSAGLLLIPSLLIGTLVRGADNSLRKSLHRSVLEVLYVPIPSVLRRKTKTFIDSVVDAGAEGLGAVIVFLWVTLPGLPSRYLSIFVMVISAYFIYLSRRMGRRYATTITEQLIEGGAGGPEAVARLDQSLLMSATFTEVDLRSALGRIGAEPVAALAAAAAGVEAGAEVADDLLQRLGSSSPVEVGAALAEGTTWTEAHLPVLTRLLARDALRRQAISVLADMGDGATPYLAAELGDETGDFVIRRRIPRVFAQAGGTGADDALLDALSAGRFEIRYRAASALVSRRRSGVPESERDAEEIIWDTIRREVGRDRPVWELQRLLDDWGAEDDLVARHAEVRGDLSLKHTFRLLSLVLDPGAVRAAYQGITSEDERLLSLALEYLEQALPKDIREQLWPFIGDLTERQRSRAIRSIEVVVEELVETGATLFASAEKREALRRMIEKKDS